MVDKLVGSTIASDSGIRGKVEVTVAGSRDVDGYLVGSIFKFIFVEPGPTLTCTAGTNVTEVFTKASIGLGLSGGIDRRWKPEIKGTGSSLGTVSIGGKYPR
jgi:hypothetical protein